jgi:hypothetical protein
MRNFNDIGRIKVFLKDPNKKSFLKIIKEITVLAFIKKEIPFYYFKYIYKKKIKNYLDYLSTKEVVSIGNSKILHKTNYKAIFDNKLFFALFFNKTSINSPKLISYNLGHCFFFDKKSEVINSKKELIIFFEKVLIESNIDGLFFRPPMEYGGKGCFKLTKQSLKTEIERRYDSLVIGSFVHTKIIEQHADINKIHSNSVNTIRIISLITPENTIEIISATMRFGVGKSILDNSSSGGFYVGIDINHGTLNDTGLYLLEYGGGEVFTHPDSGVKLMGFKIPYFKEACNEVIKANKMIPDRFIGWDVAITQNGPTIVEANSDPHIFASDFAYGGLLKNKSIKNLVREVN